MSIHQEFGFEELWWHQWSIFSHFSREFLDFREIADMKKMPQEGSLSNRCLSPKKDEKKGVSHQSCVRTRLCLPRHYWKVNSFWGLVSYIILRCENKNTKTELVQLISDISPCTIMLHRSQVLLLRLKHMRQRDW